jgi:uncharacterized SAM-binding protein YcdF (DUF218 family)
MKDVLESLGVPSSAIIVEPESRNTFENARHVRRMVTETNFSGSKILLVTSAFHLPRATAIFRKQGLEVVPVPSSFLSGNHYGWITGLLPDPVNICRTQTAIKEYVGRLAYWIVGRA